MTAPGLQRAIVPHVRRAIEAHARHCYPQECCGLVVRGEYIACRNVAADPARDFAIAAADYVAAEDLGTIEAVVHSHPRQSARPSMADFAACDASGVQRWIIVSVAMEHGAPTVQQWHEFGPADKHAPLIGCAFEHGSNDCYGLIRRYYQRAMNIQLPDFARKGHWWKDCMSNLYLDHYHEAGFHDVSAASCPRPADVLLMRIASRVPNHAAIYLGDDVILHHLWGQLSRQDTLPRYRDHITHVLRHRTLV